VTKFDNILTEYSLLSFFFHFGEIFAFKKKDGQDIKVRKNNSKNRQITIYLVFSAQ